MLGAIGTLAPKRAPGRLPGALGESVERLCARRAGEHRRAGMKAREAPRRGATRAWVTLWSHGPARPKS